MNSEVRKFREIIVRECKEKHGLDPRESDVRGSYHVELTFSVEELRIFLVATAEKSSDAFPTFLCECCEKLGPWIGKGQFDHLCPACGGEDVNATPKE